MIFLKTSFCFFSLFNATVFYFPENITIFTLKQKEYSGSENLLCIQQIFVEGLLCARCFPSTIVELLAFTQSWEAVTYSYYFFFEQKMRSAFLLPSSPLPSLLPFLSIINNLEEFLGRFGHVYSALI